MRLLCITLLLGVVVLAKTSSINALELPPEAQKCHYGDSACLTATMQHFFTNFAATGVRQIHLPIFDPLRIKLLKLDKNTKSPVSVELKFKDVDLKGLSNAKIEKVSGFVRDVNGIAEVSIFAPKIMLSGPYSVDGSVLILPIVGHGNSLIELENLNIMIKMKLKAVQKDGKTFLEVSAIKLDLTPQKVSYKLEGLFNGDKALGDNMNRFINENWKDIFVELQSDLSRALGLIVKHIINSVFSKYPYEEYFLQD